MAEPNPPGAELPDQHRLPDLEGTHTWDHLCRAYVRDSALLGMMQYFARVAEIEGLPEVGLVLRELAENQSVIAGGHLDLLKRASDPLSRHPIGETAWNLQALLRTVTADLTDTFPVASRSAHAEGFADIASWFETLARVRAAQRARLDEAVARSEEGSP